MTSEPAIRSTRVSSTVERVVLWLEDPHVALPLLVTLGLALRLHNLRESLWFDEVAYSTHFRNPDLQGLWAFLMRLPGPPLYPVLAYAWVALLGDNEVVVRLPSLVFGLGSILLTYFIATRVEIRGVPFLAALFVCLSPTHIWYSQEATPYAMTVFCLLAAVWIWPRVSTMPFAWKTQGLYLLLILVAAFTHFYTAVCLLSFTILAMTAAREARYRILLIHGVAVLALVAWLAVRFANKGDLPTAPGFLRPFTLFEWWMLFFQWFLNGNSLWTVPPDQISLENLTAAPAQLVLQGLFALVIVAGLWPDRREAHGTSRELSLHLLTLPLVVWAATLVSGKPLYIERYLLISFPFFAIAIARGAARAPTTIGRVGAVCAIVAVALTSSAAFRVKEGQWTVFKPNPDWRSAAAYLASQNDGPDRLLVMGGVPLADFLFYLSKQWPEPLPRVREYTPQRFERLLRRGGGVQVVLVKNRFWKGDIDAKIAQFQRNSKLQFATLTSFNAVDLLTFVPREPQRAAVGR